MVASRTASINAALSANVLTKRFRLIKINRLISLFSGRVNFILISVFFTNKIRDRMAMMACEIKLAQAAPSK